MPPARPGHSKTIIAILFIFGFFGAGGSFVAISTTESPLLAVIAFLLGCVLLGICVVGELLCWIGELIEQRPHVGQLQSPLPVIATKSDTPKRAPASETVQAKAAE